MILTISNLIAQTSDLGQRVWKGEKVVMRIRGTAVRLLCRTAESGLEPHRRRTPGFGVLWYWLRQEEYRKKKLLKKEW